jgi:photoactive yellow protein
MDLGTTEPTTLGFATSDLLTVLDAADDATLDQMPFGVVRMDRAGNVVSYNAFESRISGLSPSRVIGRHFFSAVAPCMNNFMVAWRFESEDAFDAVIDYMFTLRMRPTPVRLRLLKAPEQRFMYLLTQPR